MRKFSWPVGVVVGLAILIGGSLLYRATSTPSTLSAPAGVSATVPLRATAPAISAPAISAPAIGAPADTAPPVAPPPAAATAAQPVPDAPSTDGAPAASPGSAAGAAPDTAKETAPANETAAADASAAPPDAPSEPAPVVAAPPPTPGSDLPVVAVAPRVVHVVPEKEALQAPSVTLTDRHGRVMKHILPQPASPAVAALPPPRLVPAPLNGSAPGASGAMRITVSGQPVKLFGVRPAETTDVCLGRDGHARPCGEVARDALAVRLATFSGVHCRTPPGPRGDGGSICLDGAGIDLAGLLVGEGLALANPRESNDYVGAEAVARSNKRGLWHYR